MSKVGILTFHYSTNYGGVLQAYSLQKAVESLGYDAEIINLIPSNYNSNNVISNLGFKKNIFKNTMKDLNIANIVKRVKIMNKYSNNIVNKFDSFRNNEMKLSKCVDELTINMILNNYDTIIVGSDQVWNPSQRKSPVYFLNFEKTFNGRKISYAADSTTSDISNDEMDLLRKALNDFEYISVRNKHSYDFVKTIINKESYIVADPTLLVDLEHLIKENNNTEDYILIYILGKEIDGGHINVIKKIKEKYGNISVYSIKITNTYFELKDYADKVFYDLGPDEWVTLFKNAKFIYTDSFHGTLFSLKFHKPFLAYYIEQMRASRFIDLANRYNVDRFIVNSVDEVDNKKSLELMPDFDQIDQIVEEQKQYSFDYLNKALRTE